MPHVTVEYSGNIGESLDATALMQRVHELLSSYETFNRNEIKSRCYRAEKFYVANGDASHAFVHLRLDILAGRELALKQALGPKLTELLREAFLIDTKNTRVDVSVEIRDMARESYFKLKN